MIVVRMTCGYGAFGETTKLVVQRHDNRRNVAIAQTQKRRGTHHVSVALVHRWIKPMLWPSQHPQRSLSPI